MTTNYQAGDQSADLRDQLKQDLGARARDASRQFTEQGKEQAEKFSSKAADALEDMEAAATAEADVLDERGWESLSGYVREFADGIGNLSDDLRHKNVDELVQSVTGLAQRNTGLFLLGSVAIGLGLSRFIKAAPGASPDIARPSPRPEANAAPSYPAGETAFDAFASDEYRPYESH